MRIREVLLALLAAAGAVAVPHAVVAKSLNVVASFTILADVVREVGGDRVAVKSLVPADGDPHAFEPSPDDARALKEANVAIVGGDGLEPWFARLVRASGYSGRLVVASEGIKPLTVEEHGKTITDPHVWNSPTNVAVWVANIETALSAADPASADAFRANAGRYAAELRDLDAYARARIGEVPKDRRKVLTSHDAFGHLGREYGVTFLSPIGVSTDAEASAADVAKLIRQIKREKVKAYFVESSNDPRLVKQVAAATGAEPGGELYVESLSPPDGHAPTYVSMFRFNVDRLVAAMMR